jgi:hypothetical protein
MKHCHTLLLVDTTLSDESDLQLPPCHLATFVRQYLLIAAVHGDETGH